MLKLFGHNVMRKKTVESAVKDAEEEDNQVGAESAAGQPHEIKLKRCLTRWDVIAYGVSSTVGKIHVGGIGEL